LAGVFADYNSVENARNRYEAAKATVQGVRDFQSLPFPDDSFALDHALLAECRALAEFNRVLILFNDRLVNGTIPDED